MLAQNFKMPADLQITDAEFEALVKVLGMLERKEIQEAPREVSFKSVYEGAPAYSPTMFCMESEVAEADCGTACCLLGWGRKITNDASLFNSRFAKRSGIYELFFPENGAIWCRDPAVGAIALRNYLTFGEPRWDEALAD